MANDRAFLDRDLTDEEIGIFGLTSEGIAFAWCIVPTTGTFSMLIHHGSAQRHMKNLSRAIGSTLCTVQFMEHINVPVF